MPAHVNLSIIKLLPSRFASFSPRLLLKLISADENVFGLFIPFKVTYLLFLILFSCEIQVWVISCRVVRYWYFRLPARPQSCWMNFDQVSNDESDAELLFSKRDILWNPRKPKKQHCLMHVSASNTVRDQRRIENLFFLKWDNRECSLDLLVYFSLCNIELSALYEFLLFVLLNECTIWIGIFFLMWISALYEFLLGYL